MTNFKFQLNINEQGNISLYLDQDYANQKVNISSCYQSGNKKFNVIFLRGEIL
jgi:hypothetical protein